MGCDIHMHAERLVNGRWVYLGEKPDVWRDYHLFWTLGGIERRPSDIPPISKRRGIPGDATEEVKKELDDYGVDAHSASWVSLAELDDFAARHPDECGQTAFWEAGRTTLRHCFMHDDCAASASLALACVGSTDNIRLVFGFDN